MVHILISLTGEENYGRNVAHQGLTQAHIEIQKRFDSQSLAKHPQSYIDSHFLTESGCCLSLLDWSVLFVSSLSFS
jgi:hypothetical protein